MCEKSDIAGGQGWGIGQAPRYFQTTKQTTSSQIGKEASQLAGPSQIIPAHTTKHNICEHVLLRGLQTADL